MDCIYRIEYINNKKYSFPRYSIADRVINVILHHARVGISIIRLGSRLTDSSNETRRIPYIKDIDSASCTRLFISYHHGCAN